MKKLSGDQTKSTMHRAVEPRFMLRIQGFSPILPPLILASSQDLHQEATSLQSPADLSNTADYKALRALPERPLPWTFTQISAPSVRFWGS